MEEPHQLGCSLQHLPVEQVMRLIILIHQLLFYLRPLANLKIFNLLITLQIQAIVIAIYFHLIVVLYFFMSKFE
jgi:hypothetical protein